MRIGDSVWYLYNTSAPHAWVGWKEHCFGVTQTEEECLLVTSKLWDLEQASRPPGTPGSSFVKHRSEFFLNRWFEKIYWEAHSLPHQCLSLFRNPSATAKPVLIEWELVIPPLENQEDSRKQQSLEFWLKTNKKPQETKKTCVTKIFIGYANA